MGLTQVCTTRLKGHIEDADTKQKLAGATVLLVELQKEVITDAQGDFVFPNLCEGNYTLRVSHISCQTVEYKIALTKDRHVDIDLPHAKNTLSEVTLNSQVGIANTGLKKELTGRQMEETRGESLASALSKLNGVNMLQTGSTISKPIIHGLHSNRIVTINNGIRQEGQQWGNEHAPEIDPFIANKLTVIKGVDELKFGSDAIGGVVLVEPKALRPTPGYAAEINTAYFSNNQQYVLSGMFEQQLKSLPGLTYRLQGTLKKGANALTPNYRLNNTGSEEKNFSITANWKKNHFSTEIFYSFFDTRVGIFEGSHIGNITDLETAINGERPNNIFLGERTYKIGRPYQDINHQLLKSKSVLETGPIKMSLLMGAQLNERKEFDITRNSETVGAQGDMGIATYTQELSAEYSKARFTHTAGVAAVQQENQYAGRYLIPAYKSAGLGGYYISKWKNEKWNAEAGLRYDQKKINSNRLRADGFEFEFNHFNFSTLGASVNGGYKITDAWKVNSNISLANRAPQVNELLSNGIHHGTATFEEGNIFLKPERSVNINLTNSWVTSNGKVNIELALYRNDINDFIYQQPVPDEPVLTIAGAFPKLRFQQNDAILKGADFSSSIEMVKALRWNLKYSMLRAKNTDSNDWLTRMPADRLQNELSYDFKDAKRFSRTYLSFEHIYVAEQTRIPDEKNGRQDYKIPPPAYGLFQADAGTTVLAGKLPITVSIALKNIFNKSYRDYLNSMRYFSDETGRNLQLRLKIPISKSY